MSDNEHPSAAPGGAPSDEEQQAEPLATLLRNALADPPPPTKSFLPSIQHRIFMQSRGRYFGSRRTRMRDPYLLLLMAALLIGAIVVAAYLTLQPLVETPSKAPAAGDLDERAASD